MAAGTVGYTDTRGNKDYTSMIAKSIGNRLKQASDMASEERAYAAGMAEAGGTSLEEAGIGKGYFFGRALGSRFGGDRIARTKGRMGMGGAGTNPATNYKERFRGGFDYNVTNQTITDVAPLSNALVVGLRGVQEGLTDVAGAIQRQGTVLNKLSQNQADMAKATMFNGYLFAMFQNQQKQSAGRDSLRREERSLEGGRGFRRGGGIGGASFGGAGGGRGMINVTPGSGGGGGDGGGVGAGIGGGLLSAGTSLLTSNRRSGVPLAKTIGVATGLGTTAKTGIYASDVLRAAGRASKGLDPTKVGANVAKLIDPSTTSIFAKLLKGGDRAVDTAEMVAKSAGAVTATRTGVQQLDFMMNMTDAGKGDLASEMLDAGIRSEGLKKGTKMDAQFDADIFNSLVDRKGKKLYNRKQVEIFKELGLSPGVANYNRYLKRIRSTKFLKSGMKPIKMRAAGMSEQGIAEAIKKFYPNTSFKNLEEAVVLTEFARKIEQGVPPDDAVKFIRQSFGSEIADNVLIKGAKTAAKNSMVGKALGKAGSRSALKKIPLLGAVLGTAFAIDRARKGDFLGAGLEFSSGMLGLIPGLGSSLGFGIDGFLLARDLGMTPMRDRGSITGGANLPFFVGGRGFTMNEKGSGDERIRVESDDKSRHLDAGIGFIEAMKSKKNDYVKIMGQGVYSGIGDAASGGLFENIGGGISNMVEGIKEMFGNLKDGFTDTFNNLKESLVNKFNNFKDAVGNKINNVKQWWNKDSSDGSMIDNARFNVQKFINRRILGKKDAKYMKDYNPTEGVTYGSLPSDYKETEAKYFQTGMYTPNVENDGINVVPGNITGHTVITNNYYGGGSDGGGVDTGDANPLVSDLGIEYIAANMSLASKT